MVDFHCFAPSFLRGKTVKNKLFHYKGLFRSPEVRSRIFEPFFTTKELGKGQDSGCQQSTVSSSRAAEASGLQRSWAWDDVQNLLPKTILEEQRSELKDTMRQQQVAQVSETILVAEDDSTVRGFVQLILRKAGYTVLAASNGPEALKLLQNHPGPIDLMLTDMVMPQTNIRELSQALAQLRPAAKLLYVSGFTDDAVIRHGVLEEGVNFVQKPFSAAVLRKKIRTLLDGT